jgi:hypothetical protein
MDLLPLESYYEIILYGGLSCIPNLLQTCSNIYNTINNNEYSVFIWLSQYLSKIQHERELIKSISNTIIAADRKYLRQLNQLMNQYEQVMNRFERRKQEQIEMNESYKVQAVCHMLKQFCYSCCLKSVRRHMNTMVTKLKQDTSLTGPELIHQYTMLLAVPDRLFKFVLIGDKKAEERVLSDRVKIVNSLTKGSSLLLYFVCRYCEMDCEQRGNVDDFFNMVNNLVNNFKLSACSWNGKQTKCILHYANQSNDEIIIDKCINLYNEHLKLCVKPVRPHQLSRILYYCLVSKDSIQKFYKYLNTVYDPYIQESISYLLSTEDSRVNLFVVLPLEDIKELIQKFDISNAVHYTCLNAVLTAVSNENYDELKEKIIYLVDKGCAKVNSQWENSLPVSLLLQKFYLHNKYDLLKLLLDGGATVPSTAIAEEVRLAPKIESVRLLVEYGASIHVKLWEMSPIMRLFMKIGELNDEELLEIAEYLLEKGADPSEWFSESMDILSCLRLLHKSDSKEIIDRGEQLLEKYGVTKEKDIDANGIAFATYMKNQESEEIL